MNATELIAARARQARAVAENVPSPCVSVCRMVAASGLCEGCWRSLDEIRAWSRASDADKRAIWALVEARASAALAAAPMPTP